MGQVYIEELSRYEGQEVTIKGWVYNRRSSGKINSYWFVTVPELYRESC